MGQNVSRRSKLYRRLAGPLVLFGVVVFATASESSAQDPLMGYNASVPSGSISGDVLNFNGRGAGVQWRGGHVAGDTIGRQDSISFLGAMPYATFGNGLVFGDARLARANEGGLAWSFGSGLRYYFHDVDAVFGLNGYFDRDQHTGAHFNQWGVGAELLSHNWEWRGNMYKPFGQTSDRVAVDVVPNSSAFDGNQVLFDQVETFAAALEGFDTEVGFLLPGRLAAKHQVRAFGGAYYYEAAEVDFTGWKARVQGNLFDWLEMNLQVTNDEVFDTNVTFGVAVNLGGYRENVAPNNSRYRLGEAVRRTYTFTTDAIERRQSAIVATNPATGAPFDITHVSSRAGLVQDGTVENPFATIAAGQAAGGDIILVHAGSVFDSVPENSVFLNSGERILGEGQIGTDRIAQHFLDVADIGQVPIGPTPDFLASALTLDRPTLANSAADTVTLATNSEFSGFRIIDSGNHGIFASGVADSIADQNLISGALGDGVQLVNPTGIYGFTDTVIQDTSGTAFHVAGGDAEVTFTQSTTDNDPGFGRIVNSSGFAVRVRDTTGGEVQLIQATIDDDFGQGISIENADGDVTVDNAVIEDSTSHGINIDGGNGTFRFLASIRDAITINRAALNSVNIVNLGPNGRVLFSDQLNIDDRVGSALNFDNIAGAITINGDIVIDGHAAGGLAPAVSFTNSPATASVTFRDSLTISNANGPGILISGNQFDDAIGDRAGFSVGTDGVGLTTFNNVDGDNLRIVNDASGVRFSGILSNGRGADPAILQDAHGILISNSTGRLAFLNNTLITNPNGVPESALEITGSQAEILFESFTATGTTGDPGVLLTGNVAGPLGDATILFEQLSVDSTNGDALFANNNTSIQIQDGVIVADTGTAVDIENSGIDIEFTSVSSDAADHGIRLVDNFEVGTNVAAIFEVLGDSSDQAAGNGGTIEAATIAGAFLRNTGIVRLNQMLFDDNEVGVDVQYTGLTDPPVGLLELDNTNFEDNNTRAIDGLNIPQLLIADGVYEDNGDDAANGRETIRLQYDERPNDPDTIDPDDYDFPFVVSIVRSNFENDADDLIDIRASGGAEDAHLDLLVEDNVFEVNDATDADGLDQNDDALIVRWDGPLLGTISGNSFALLAQNNDTQIGIDIFNDSSTDFTDLGILGNTFDIRGDGNGATNNRNFGLIIEIDSDGALNISNNAIELQGGDATAIELDLDGEVELLIATNSIQDQFDVLFASDYEGIDIDRIGEGSLLVFDNNLIDIDGDFGLRVDAFGVIELDGPDRPNTIFAFNFGSQDFIFTGPTPIGQLNINGNLLP